ncbi:MAG: hypothetical protein K1X79_00970 [Oligoflexia bacterium]|nr:hypothetical protein [Oligoflexia bacterium]
MRETALKTNRSELGAAVAEYTLAIAAIAFVVIGGATELGLRTRDVFVCYLDMSLSDGELLASGALGDGVGCEVSAGIDSIAEFKGGGETGTDESAIAID